MSRRTRKEKVKLQKKRKIQQAQLKNLEIQAKALEEKINKQRKENIKNSCIKNLKIFGSFCNYIAPYILAGTITFTGFKVFAGGNPIVKDDIVKYKKYTLSYQTDKEINANETYEENYWFSDTLPSNELTLYYPWTANDDGTYSRIIREYNIGPLKTTDLYNAILEQNIDYILETFSDYNEEKETSNYIYDNDGFIIDASINMFDKEDIIKYSESDLKNILITISEIAITIAAGLIINKVRDFDLSYSVTRIKDRYRITSIEPLQNQLNSINNKILSLKRGGINL